MKERSRPIAAVVTAVTVCVLLVSSGCCAPHHEGFAIYLTEGDISPAQMPALSQVEIAEQPVIAMSDIITYNAQTHELKLTASAYERISTLEVPVEGRSFVVCVDGEAIYFGAFWTPISSMAFEGVTIWQPLSFGEPHIVTLELGYPSSAFYEGEDPRNNPEIIGALEEAGKLITGLSIAAVDELPQSMKGYELYSWPEDSQWHFTLITGTDRNKTLEEVTAGEDYISETGWVRVHVAGVDAIKAALSKLQQGEEVFWLAALREETEQTDIDIQLPPEPTVCTIEEHAEQCGLHLMIQTP